MRPALRFAHASLAAVCTLAVTLFCFRLLRTDAATAAVLLFLVVLLTGAYTRFTEAIVVSILATLCLDYFFIPPVGSITIADPEGWIILLAFLAVAFVTSYLSDRLRQQRNEIAIQQNESERLHIFSRSMLLSSSADDIPRLGVNKCIELFGFDAVVLYERGTGLFQSSGLECDVMVQELLRTAAVRGSAPQISKNSWTITPAALGNKVYGSLAFLGRDLPESTLHAIANTIALGIAQAQAQESLTRAEAVRKSEELKSTMIDALAHDLKTPLTAIEAAAEVLSVPAGVSPEQRADLLGVICEESAGLRRLVNEAIHLAKIDTKRLKLECSSIPVRDLVGSAAAALGDRTAAGRINIEIAGSGPLVFGDRELLPVAIRQLLDNALKYSPSNSGVTVSAICEEGSVSIRVRDHGPGLTELEQGRVFDKLYRGHRDFSAIQGTGMGLAIAKEIAEAHGGSAGVYSHVGEGSEFFLVIPAGDSKPAAVRTQIEISSGEVAL